MPIELLDLDEYEEQLFGAPKPRETTAWNDDFLLNEVVPAGSGLAPDGPAPREEDCNPRVSCA